METPGLLKTSVHYCFFRLVIEHRQMIYYFLYELLYNHFKDKDWFLIKALNVFQLFRTAYASITALLLSLVFGGRLTLPEGGILVSRSAKKVRRVTRSSAGLQRWEVS